MIFLIAALLVSSTARAECSNVDLNSGPSPFRKIPIYDQDGTGICYAFAASQLVDYHRFKKGETGLTNPIYAALAYKNRSGFLSTDSGYAHRTIEELRKNGVCADEEVKKRLGKYAGDAGLTEAQFLSFLEDTWEPKGRGSSRETWGRNVMTYTDYNLSNGATTKNAYERICALKDRLTDEGLFSIPPRLFLQKAFAGCETKPIQIPKLLTVTFPSKLRPVIDKYLAKGEPSAISFCQELFDKESYINLPFNCEMHVALVVGSKKVGQKCEYLIRNSWGAHWKPKLSKGCACLLADGSYKDKCEPGEGKETVGCWVDDEKLTKSLWSVDVFKETPAN